MSIKGIMISKYRKISKQFLQAVKNFNGTLNFFWDLYYVTNNTNAGLYTSIK